jgi:hypothetical protein
MSGKRSNAASPPMRRKPSKARKSWKAYEEQQPTRIDSEIEVSGVPGPRGVVLA